MARVVTAALGALGPLLGKLADLLANECGRLKGVRREIRSLHTEFSIMETALDQYATLQDPGRQVKQWVSLVRELAYDTEDLFDKFMRHLGNANRHDGGYKQFFRKTVRCLKTLGARHGIASQIEDLKRRIKEVKDLKTSYELPGIDCSMARHATIDPRLAALGEAHLVGIDGPRDDLAKWMEEENKHRRRVLSIVGFGGLGKTTLANAVYHKIQRHFDCHAFVSVSQKPDRKKIIRSVFSQVPHDSEFTRDMDTWDEWQYITNLRELLQNKRYLVIIDDIWSSFAWNAIECAFPENDCSSRIIATTRDTEVAQSCSPDRDDKIYEMRPLSDLNSERLFFKRIFGSKDSCPKMLSEVSYAILKKCGGLPLAIISISSLLANRPRVKEEWEKVKSSIGSDLSKNQNLEGMRNILSLSYDDLSPNLKTCLLYLSNFPEDCVIGRDRLVRRWIAEGLIPEERGRSHQEVAETYFNELMNKSLIQPVGVDYDGRPRHACQVHDMMRELIISKSTEENFITLVNGRQTVWEDSHCFIRRLSIQEIDQELASVLANKDLSHVRSLTVTSASCVKYLPSLAKFKALRVLDFEGCEGFGCLKDYDMNGMEDLFHLKYLSFRNTDISELPPGIVMLHQLETLDLRGTTVWELPSGIAELNKLQHLLFIRSNAISALEIPTGIGRMTNLREILGLSITRSSVEAVEELGNLINLNAFGVQFDPDVECLTDKYKRHADALLSSLRKLCCYKLQSVCIDCGNIDWFDLLGSWSPPSGLQSFEMKPYYCLSELKLTAPALTSLVNLRINLREVTEEDLLILGELPALLYLNLQSTVQKDRLTVKEGGFGCLKQFALKVYEAVWECLLFEKGAMPDLERLSLTVWVRGLASTADAYGFYLGIEHLKSLNVIELNVSESHLCYEDGISSVVSSICKSARAGIKKEANLHPRVTLYGEDENCDIDDEVNEDQNAAGVEVNVELAGVEVNEDQNDADDEANEKQSDADEYSDAISSPMHEGNHSP